MLNIGIFFFKEKSESTIFAGLRRTQDAAIRNI